MTVEKALEWIELKNFSHWVLLRGENEKIDEYDVDDAEATADDSLQSLAIVMEMLPPGSYMLKGRKGKSKNAANMSFRFRKTSDYSSAVSSSNNLDVQEIFTKAKEAAFREYAEKAWKEKIEARLDNIEKLIQQLTDEDVENDADAIETFTEKVTQISGAFNGLKGFLSPSK